LAVQDRHRADLGQRVRDLQIGGLKVQGVC
jgi:hypothetical protein